MTAFRHVAKADEVQLFFSPLLWLIVLATFRRLEMYWLLCTPQPHPAVPEVLLIKCSSTNRSIPTKAGQKVPTKWNIFKVLLAPFQQVSSSSRFPSKLNYFSTCNRPFFCLWGGTQFHSFSVLGGTFALAENLLQQLLLIFSELAGVNKTLDGGVDKGMTNHKSTSGDSH